MGNVDKLIEQLLKPGSLLEVTTCFEKLRNDAGVPVLTRSEAVMFIATVQALIVNGTLVLANFANG